MFALNTNIIPSQYVCLSTSNPAYISMQYFKQRFKYNFLLKLTLF